MPAKQRYTLQRSMARKIKKKQVNYVFPIEIKKELIIKHFLQETTKAMLTLHKQISCPWHFSQMTSLIQFHLDMNWRPPASSAHNLQ